MALGEEVVGERIQECGSQSGSSETIVGGGTGMLLKGHSKLCDSSL